MKKNMLPAFSVIVFWLFSIISLSLCAPYMETFVYGGCSQLKYSGGSSYSSNVNSLLTSLLNLANFSPYNNYSIRSPPPDSTLSGLYQCRGDISVPDCAGCVQTAISQLGVLCSSSCGGVIQLQGCFVKYDNASFLGTPDKTLVFKKCGVPSGGTRTDLLSRRDEALTELASGGGAFRLYNVGYVSGMAQCVGDLNAGECSDCVSEAIERLRGGCGTTISGDVYLGKCYARYTTTGVFRKNSDDSGDEAGKTLAIIVGLIAGVVLLVVFLSFLTKACQGGKGK